VWAVESAELSSVKTNYLVGEVRSVGQAFITSGPASVSGLLCGSGESLRLSVSASLSVERRVNAI